MKRFRYGTAVAEVSPAEGVTGILCSTIGGKYFFRVYHAAGEFTDYRLRHNDLEVTISQEALASFYRIGDDGILDHSPQVLGLAEVRDP